MQVPSLSRGCEIAQFFVRYMGNDTTMRCFLFGWMRSYLCKIFARWVYKRDDSFIARDDIDDDMTGCDVLSYGTLSSFVTTLWLPNDDFGMLNETLDASFRSIFRLFVAQMR